MVIARAYRHTEKLLQDNKEKLALVSSAYFKRFFFIFTYDSGCFVFLSHNRQHIVPPVGPCTVGA